MANIAMGTTFVDDTIAEAAEVNANFATIVTAWNTFAVQKDTTGTIAAVHTYSVSPIFSFGTASQTLELDGSKSIVTAAITGTGNYVKSASPTFTGTISAAALTLSGAFSGGSVTTSGTISSTYVTANGKWLQGPSVTASRSYSSLHGLTLQYGSGDTSSDLLCNAAWDSADGRYEYLVAETATLFQLGTSGAVNLYVAGAGGVGTEPAFIRAWGVDISTGSMAILNTPSTSAALTLAATTTARSSLRVPHGTAPTSPVNGDVWTTTAGIFVRVNGATVGPLS